MKKSKKSAEDALDDAVLARYASLTEDEVKTVVVEDTWLAALQRDLDGELERAGQRLTNRVRELADRYAAPLPQLSMSVETLQARVEKHLQRMGFAWT